MRKAFALCCLGLSPAIAWSHHPSGSSTPQLLLNEVSEGPTLDLQARALVSARRNDSFSYDAPVAEAPQVLVGQGFSLGFAAERALLRAEAVLLYRPLAANGSRWGIGDLATQTYYIQPLSDGHRLLLGAESQWPIGSAEAGFGLGVVQQKLQGLWRWQIDGRLSLQSGVALGLAWQRSTALHLGPSTRLRWRALDWLDLQLGGELAWFVRAGRWVGLLVDGVAVSAGAALGEVVAGATARFAKRWAIGIAGRLPLTVLRFDDGSAWLLLRHEFALR